MEYSDADRGQIFSRLAEKLKANAERWKNEKVVRTYEVTDTQQNKIDEWLTGVEKRGLESGKLRSELEALGYGDANTPYYGAIGGGIEYCFYSTSLGDILVVKHSATEEEINVTDFDSW